MSKRRVFDIDFPETAPVPAGTEAAEPARRSPMAAAITENAGALRERAEAERAIREENDRLAHEHVRLKKAGLITDLVPLDRIRTTKLTRDRSLAADPDLEELKQSIRDIGLSNAIQVEVSDDGYELVQGYRRLSAYRALYEETGDESYARIPAGLVAGGEALEALYRRMVDENLVRRDISFAEMAQLAIAYADDPETGATSVDQAIGQLYASAGRQKRSYIRHFATLLRAIGSRLRHAQAIPRKLGLDLERRLSEPGFAARLQARLTARGAHTAEQELEVLREAASTGLMPRKSVTPRGKSAAKTTLRCTVPAGTVRCAARDGKVELSMERDFSSIDRHRLEAAVAAFMAELDD